MRAAGVWPGKMAPQRRKTVDAGRAQFRLVCQACSARRREAAAFALARVSGFLFFLTDCGRRAPLRCGGKPQHRPVMMALAGFLVLVTATYGVLSIVKAKRHFAFLRSGFLFSAIFIPRIRPGEFPFTRGIYSGMYRDRLWTMRQYAGFGTAEEAMRGIANL